MFIILGRPHLGERASRWLDGQPEAV